MFLNGTPEEVLRDFQKDYPGGISGPLDERDQFVVYSYTHRVGFGTLNRELWAEALRGEPLTGYNQARRRLLKRALAQLPDEERELYRKLPPGVTRDYVLSRYVKGTVVTEPAFLSCTRDLAHASERPGNILFIVNGRSARNLEPYSAVKKEREHLYPDGTSFYVDDVLVNDDEVWIFLEEVAASKMKKSSSRKMAFLSINQDRQRRIASATSAEDASGPSSDVASTMIQEWKEKIAERVKERISQMTPEERRAWEASLKTAQWKEEQSLPSEFFKG